MLFLFLAATQILLDQPQITSSVFSKTPEGFRFNALIGNLTLRTAVPDDFNFFNELQGDEKVRRYMGLGEARNEEQNREHFNRLLTLVRSSNPTALLAITNRKGQVLGFGGLHEVDPKNPKPGFGEFFGMFDPSKQGQGLGTLVLLYLVQIIGPEIRRLGLNGIKQFQHFNGHPLSTIYATYHPNNKASESVLRKMGFKLVEGEQPRQTQYGPRYIVECLLPTSQSHL